MNVHDLAVRVSHKEGGHRNLSIADIKEVIKLTMIELANNDDMIDTIKTVMRYKKKR